MNGSPGDPALPVRPDIARLEAAERRHRRRVRWGAAIAIVVAVVAGTGWATDGFTAYPHGLLNALAPPCPPTVSLNGTGSSLVERLMDTWVGAYEGGASARNQGCHVVDVSFNSSSDGAGLLRLGSGSTGFVATEEPLSPSARAALPSPVLTLPVALSAVAVAYHLPGVPAGLNLSGAVLAAIYLGNVTRWSDVAIASLNPGVSLPTGLPITVIHDGSGSSTSFVFTGYLAAENATWAARVGQGSTVAWPTGLTATSEADAAAQVAATSGAIAYLGLPAAEERNLTCAQLENPEGVFLRPTPASTFAAALSYPDPLPLGNQSWQNISLLNVGSPQAYPLVTYTYAVEFADLGVAYHGSMTENTAGWLAAFLYYMAVAGQGYGTSLGYAPLPASTTRGDLQIVELLRYDGVAALGDIDYDGD